MEGTGSRAPRRPNWNVVRLLAVLSLASLAALLFASLIRLNFGVGFNARTYNILLGSELLPNYLAPYLVFPWCLYFVLPYERIVKWSAYTCNGVVMLVSLSFVFLKLTVVPKSLDENSTALDATILNAATFSAAAAFLVVIPLIILTHLSPFARDFDFFRAFSSCKSATLSAGVFQNGCSADLLS